MVQGFRKQEGKKAQPEFFSSFLWEQQEDKK